MSTVFDVCNWNIASPRWYTPWAPRARDIKVEIIGDASLYSFQEIYSSEQVRTIQEALPTFGRVLDPTGGPAGLECFYDEAKWKLETAASYTSGVQGRHAVVAHLKRKQTGQHIALINCHGPTTYDSWKDRYGNWLGRLIDDVQGPIILTGDFNRSKHDDTPRSNVRARGFRCMDEQAAVVHESSSEFPSKGWKLCDIYTRPREAKITGGEIHYTSSRLSDHRELTARVVIP
jgi:endonuclease/exonuclease/phosphatase (EEP) superfamily protein YafD